MAKKKGGGTNLGLIITLVFFVLTTVILGVTTYMGYSDQETKETAKKEAEKGKAVADADAKYLRMQVRILRPWMGYPVAGVEAAEVAREKKLFEDNQFPAAANQKDKEEVVKLFKTLGEAMPWGAGDATPTLTYEQRLTKFGTDLADSKAKTKKAEDAVKQALPMGARAVQIADGGSSTYFLTTFGRATRETVCSCEVKMEPTLSQALHLLNGDTVNAKIQQGGVIKKLLDTKKFPEERVVDLYLRTVSRMPSEDELKKLMPLFAPGTNAEQSLLDLFWSLLNSREFLFNH